MTLADYCATKSRPDLLAEWDTSGNSDILPDQVSFGAGKAYRWKCRRGHTWFATVNSRTNPNIESGCPYCAGKRPIIDENDLASRLPKLASEWSMELNNGLSPADVTIYSNRTVWWKCSLGHAWQARVADRVIDNNGCPYCSNRKLLTGFNDLATVAPELAEEWDREKNGSLKPETTLYGSAHSVWWKCALGHEWKATVDNRYTKKSGCPYCTGRKLLVGFNDLATTEPQIAEQWHPFLNGKLTQQMVMRGSHKQVWWLCQDGHVWKARISSRATGKRCGCPVCSGRISKKKMHLYDRILVERAYLSSTGSG